MIKLLGANELLECFLTSHYTQLISSDLYAEFLRSPAFADLFMHFVNMFVVSNGHVL